VSHTLFITNDFPPRPGGIQTFVYELVRQFPSSDVTVLSSTWEGAKQFDQSHDFEVVRADTKVLLPTPATLSLARKIIVAKNVKTVIFGAAAPLALLAKPLRTLGVKQIIAFTHGHEAGWAKTPGTKQALKKIGNDVDVLTYLTQYTKQEISKGLSNSAVASMRQLLPAVDPQFFNPGNQIEGSRLREKVGFANRPTIVSVSRLMARKGHDELIKAMPELKKRIPGIALLIVGDGSYRDNLEKLITKLDLELDVYLTGKVPYIELPAWYGAGDVFVMPCRTRKAGWDVEGLGIVYLEASATGLPVIAGDSGGAPEAVAEGKSGFVVGGLDQKALVEKIELLFSDENLRKEIGEYGRQWILDNWTWDKPYARLQKLIAGIDPDN
jgi:phosphatidylinositol alpha-1,6-mannosyltransferase